MKWKNAFCLILAGLLAASALSCGGTEPENPTGSDTSGSSSDSAAPEAEYAFTDKYSGRTFAFLNAGDIYSMHAQIDRERADGEMLNDAMYNRCRTLEEKMGITLEETIKASMRSLPSTQNRFSSPPRIPIRRSIFPTAICPASPRRICFTI